MSRSYFFSFTSVVGKLSLGDLKQPARGHGNPKWQNQGSNRTLFSEQTTVAADPVTATISSEPQSPPCSMRVVLALARGEEK